MKRQAEGAPRPTPAQYITHDDLMKKTFVTTALAAALLPGMALADPEPQEVVLRAAQNGEAQLTHVISSCTSIDATEDDGETALMKACSSGHIEAVKLLIKHGANVNCRDDDKMTPLMFAADEGHTEIVKVLIAAGADVNAKDEDGDTALRMAEDEHHGDTASVLRAAGAQ